MFKNGARWLIPSLALLLMLAACGSVSGEVATLNSPEEGSTATPAPSVDPEDAIFAFAECMREHGIDMPDPQIVSGGPGEGSRGFINRDDSPDGPTIDPNSDEFQAALEACRDLMEGFAAPGGEQPELTEEQEQAMIDFAECMREHGIDMPDPQSGGGGISIGPGEEPPFDPFSEEFQAAQEACGDILGDFGPRFEVNQ